MARTATKRKNFLGFSKKTTYSPKLVQAAYDAGRKSGDTSAFKAWVARQGNDLAGSFKRRLEKQYRAGIESLWKEEKKEEKKLKTEQKQTAAKEAKYELAQTVKDVASALQNQGLSKTEAMSAARRAYKAGDSFEDTFKKATQKNPKKQKRRTSLGPRSSQAERRQLAKALELDTGMAKALGLRKRESPARRLQGPAKRKNAKAKKSKRNYQSVVWSSKLGGATAEVYKMGKDRFEVELIGRDGSAAVIPAASFQGAQTIARLKLQSLASNPSDKVKPTDLVPGSGYADTLVKAGERVYKGVKKSTAGLLKKVKAHIGGRKNPIGQAMKVYEDFHGMPSSEVLEFTEEEHFHSVKVGLGLLVSLEVLLANSNNKKVDLNAPGFSYHASQGGYWDFDEGTPLIKRVLVTSSEDGKQLFFDGGDQAIPDAALEQWGFTARDKHDHMVIGEIKVLTYRTQKSFDKGEVVDYFHETGSEGSKGVRPLLLYYPRSKKMKVAGGRYYIAPPDRSLGASPGLVG